MICETQVITGLRDQHQRQARSTEVSLENHVFLLLLVSVCPVPPISVNFVSLDISNSTATGGASYLGLYQISSLQAELGCSLGLGG